MVFARPLLFLLWAAFSVAQKDPLKDFCRRFGHQTAVVDRKIYIDGGLVNFSPFGLDSLNYTNKDILYADFDVNNDGMPQEYNNLTKPASIPSVNGGILWEDKVNKMLYLYGGEYYQSSPDSFTNWAYDIVNKNWTAITPDVTQGGIQRASYGAGIAVQDIGKGFYYGGWMSNQTVPSFGPNTVALSNLLSYDMIKNTWSNMTGPDSVGRAEGVMSYIPASDGGMLVYFGGVQTPSGNGSWTGVPMSEIHLYDIANEKWYTQTATGDIPDMRRRFCAGATWAQDQSSYNIYLYGGASMPPLSVGFDDVYILSIPSFTWIKWYPTAPGTPYPHHSLSCNVVEGAQMLVMGGTFPNSTSCDVPGVFAFHNMDLGKDNSEGAKWALFSPTKTKYKVPSEIIAVVGGGATGGATVKAPQYGFSDRDLTNYFQRIYKPATRTPTRALPSPTATSTSASSPPSSPQKSNVGAIAGGAAGGVVLLLAVVALLVWLCIRQRKRSAATTLDHQNDPYQQPAQGMQKRQHLPPAELTGESLHELPTTLSPTMSKSGINYHIHSLSSATPSTTYSPPHSPPHSPPQSPPLALAMHSPSYSHQDQSSSSPYAVIPPYPPQNFNQQPGHHYPVEQSYPNMQPVYTLPHPAPQQQYTSPPHQYYSSPPQDEAPHTQAPDVRRPSYTASTTTVRRREVGSVSSTGPSPRTGQVYGNE